MRHVRALLVFVLSFPGCGASTQPTPAAPVSEATTAQETPKEADAVLVELDVREADEPAIENLRTAIRRSASLSLDPSSVSPTARRLVLRFEATTPTQAGASLERTMSLTGFVNGGECQIFKLAPKLTKPGGKKDSASDVDELTSAGVQNMIGTIEGLAPKIGPNATCLATGR